MYHTCMLTCSQHKCNSWVSTDFISYFATQVTVVRVADEHPPHGHVSPVPADKPELDADGSGKQALLSRFPPFIRTMGRRRISRGGSSVPVWASFDAQEGEYQPLADYEMPEVSVDRIASHQLLLQQCLDHNA